MNHSPDMYWRLLVFSVLVLFFFKSEGREVEVSDQAEISIMTLGPYQEELYSAFGHSAIHFSDPERNIDWVFNYGVFDFDQENFYWNFARGRMLYKLGLSRYTPFKNHYARENRYIIEQRLNLTLAEKQAMVDFLTNNYKPENRDYYYNYVYDNCATKMYDVLVAVFPEQITFNADYVEDGKTIRDLMDDYLGDQPWGDWIIDIGLGMQIDKEATPREYMFLPDYIEASLSTATLRRDSLEVPLVGETVNVYVPTPEEQQESKFFTPFNFFVLVFFVVGFITNRDFKKEKRTKWLDPVVFTLAGLIGWWLVFLWWGTEHLSKDNLNLLWAIPLHIPFAYLLGVRKLQPFLSKYFLVISAGYLILLVIWSALPQPLHMALIPLILTMMLRGFYIHSDLQKQLRKANR